MFSCLQCGSPQKDFGSFNLRQAWSINGLDIQVPGEFETPNISWEGLQGVQTTTHQIFRYFEDFGCPGIKSNVYPNQKFCHVLISFLRRCSCVQVQDQKKENRQTLMPGSFLPSCYCWWNENSISMHISNLQQWTGNSWHISNLQQWTGNSLPVFFCQNSESSNNMVAHQILSHQKQTEEKVLTGRPLKHTPSKFDMPPEKMILDGGFQSKWNMSSSNWIISPGFGMRIKQHVSNHHLVYSWKKIVRYKVGPYQW